MSTWSNSTPLVIQDVIRECVSLRLRSPESPVIHAGDERRSAFRVEEKKRRTDEENGKARTRIMLIYEYKLDGTKQQ